MTNRKIESKVTPFMVEVKPGEHPYSCIFCGRKLSIKTVHFVDTSAGTASVCQKHLRYRSRYAMNIEEFIDMMGELED